MYSFRSRQAARCMQHGGVIAYPTEAVWGLGCDPFNKEACFALLQIKHRAPEKGMILIAGDICQFADLLALLTRQQQQTLADGWAQQGQSGPLTWLVPDLADQVPYWVRGEHHSVALRVSMHPLVKTLCADFGGPIVSTSANLAGMPPARSRIQLEKQLGDQLDYVLPGRLGGANRPSRIVDLLTGKTLRNG
jgi:L-threonylcarbamoyladenylate synthase